MMISNSFDRANRENREKVAYEKLEIIIDRLKMTLSDINHDFLLTDEQKERIKKKAKKKLDSI